MLDRLSEALPKRYKLALTAWILLLVISLPLMSKLEGRLIYNERAFLSDKMRSVKASKLLHDEFSGFNPPDLIVVLDNVRLDSKLESEVRGFEREVRKLEDVKGVVTPYTVYDEVRKRYWDVMNRTKEEVEEKIYNATKVLYPALWRAYKEVNMSLQLIYGMPAYYLKAWNELLLKSPPETPLKEVDERAFNSLLLPPEAEGYMKGVYKTWDSSLFELGMHRVGDVLAAMKSGKLNPEELMEKIIEDIASKKGFNVEGVTLNNFRDPDVIKKLAFEALTSKGNVSRDFLEALYRLGPNARDDDLREVANQLALKYIGEALKKHPLKFPDSIPAELRKNLISQDNETILITISVEGRGEALVREVRSLADKWFSYEHYVTGPPAFIADMKGVSLKDVSRIDLVTLILVIVLLAALLASIVAPAIPLVTVATAIVTSFAALYLESYVVDLVYVVRNLVVPLLMGVGVDYSIYMLYRFKEELEGGDEREAVKKAVRFAGEAVVSAALTVMVGFGALASSDFKMLQSMGYSLATVVFLAISSALTLTPSLLALLGRKTFWPSWRSLGGGRSSYLRKMANLSIKRPKAVVLAFLILTLVASAVLLNMKRTYDYTQLMPETESIKGFQLAKEKFNLGGSTIYLIFEFDRPVNSSRGIDEEAYEAMSRVISEIKGAGVRVISLVTNGDELVPRDRVNVTDYLLGEGGRYALALVQVNSTPYSDEALKVAKKAIEATKYSKVYVGGEPVSTYEMSDQVNKNFAYRIIPVALVLIFLVLYLLLKSFKVAASLLLAIGTSILWSLAALVVVFQFVMGKEIYWLTPIMLLTTLLGLGMDYGIFLVTRIKEELFNGMKVDEAIVKSVETTGIVITACGLIMAAAFGSLMLSNFVMLQEIGFAFATAVLVDTFVVRPLFLPSLIKAVGWN